MSDVIKNWKKSETSVHFLKEGLRLLTEPNRPTAKEVSDSGPDEMVGVYCTYGKGARPKVTLKHQEAQLLLDMVEELGSRIQAEEQLGTAVEMAAAALFEGRELQGPVAAELYEPVLKVVIDFDPRLNQLALDLQESV
jgi:hypothetical protein